MAPLAPFARASSTRALDVAVALAILASCTGADPASESNARATADAFIAAWSNRDADDMVEMFDRSVTPGWSADRLDRWMERALDRGAVESFEVVRAGAVDQATPASRSEDATERVEVPYEITYSSEAASEPATLEGSFGLVFDEDDEAWSVRWRRGLLWPGIDRARGFDVSYMWPKRAALLDRNGRRLAKGSGSRRRYPFGAVAGSTIGQVAPLAENDLEDAAEGHAAGDFVGVSGLELAFEDVLAGEPGTKLAVVDRKHRVLAVIGRAPKRPGRPLRSTLDVRVQRVAESAYGATTGGAVVIAPRTGDLLAVVSSGSFDPNNYVGISEITPFNRALSGLYPPGSAMKAVTAAAALDTGAARPATRLTGPKEYKGVRNFESGEFGTLDFATATKFSVNTAFAQVAERLGPRRLTRYARAFGFNRPPKMPLGAATSSFPFPQDEGDLMWSAIGQAQVLATPLQMASVAATIANRGKRMEPRASFQDTKRGARVIKRRTARVLGRLMENVVLGGTGSAARLAGVRVAGKTGTAEVDVEGKRKNHAWFICFAPVRRPKVAVAVVSEYGGVGGEVAAPLAGRILAGVLPLIK